MAALGQLQLKASIEQRSGDDENNEQHERQIEQGGDVEIAQSHQRVALGKAAHGVKSGLNEGSVRYSTGEG